MYVSGSRFAAVKGILLGVLQAGIIVSSGFLQTCTQVEQHQKLKQTPMIHQFESVSPEKSEQSPGAMPSFHTYQIACW